ncbi:lipo-like protein, partial [Mesorhizobium sp. M2D.F.Ca.ET.147.01.1.1]
RTYNTRICRASGLAPEDRDKVVAFMISKLGLRYDLKNIFDMLRYFMPTPPVPVRWRRRMLAFGSGDPTRAICSTLIAEAYGQIRYPILPEISR